MVNPLPSGVGRGRPHSTPDGITRVSGPGETETDITDLRAIEAPVRVDVVIADDVAQIRRLLRRILERDGRFEVVGEAADGNEAVALAAELRPRLVLLDVMMPDKDGVAALEEMRRRTPGSRIVFLSGLPSEHLESLGADLCLQKGVAFDDMVHSLDELLDLVPRDA